MSVKCFAIIGEEAPLLSYSSLFFVILFFGFSQFSFPFFSSSHHHLLSAMA
jgi:hypothetical protein